MAKSIYKQMPDEFKQRVQRETEKFERDELPEVITRAKHFFQQRERLQQILTALKTQRQKQNISLNELERRTGISKSQLSRLENNPDVNPTIKTLSRIAEALNQEVIIELKAAA